MENVKKKVLFLIHDLGQGGAEKVLVNLVNNMDCSKFDISVIALFGGGVNEQFLKQDIYYRTIFPRSFPGNSHLMKLFTPKQLHKLFIKEHYDIEIAYLEGPTMRIISGCQDKNTKLISWTHCTMHSEKEFSIGFRSYREAKKCILCFDNNIFVSREVKEAFEKYCTIENGHILYNTNDSDRIRIMSEEAVEDVTFSDDKIYLIGIGKIVPVKGFDKLARIHKRLLAEGYPIHTFILGSGPEQEKIEAFLKENKIENTFTFLGYQTNPYKYMSKCDVFVCSSMAEGFSTAATEALIIGVPVVTTPVAGMKEMLGVNGEYGLISEMKEESLYEKVKELISNPKMLVHYKGKAVTRGKDFSKENTVKAVEEFLEAECRKK